MPQTSQWDYNATARQAVIGRELRRTYGELVREPIPGDLLDLLRQIDESLQKKKADSVRLRSPEG